MNEVLTEKVNFSLDEIAVKIQNRFRRGELHTYGLGDTRTKVFGIVKQLREVDNRLTPTDALIIATACQDSDCVYLYTFDEYAMNQPLLDCVREHRLTITYPERD